ncbi:MAG: response regulator transcription factor [Dehalococcoidia bacterium]|nr:response regulator transcription factor [Dehalococcoidia bacterium]
MPNVKILIVDDDPVIVKFVRANLQANDYETIVAMNGKDGITAVEKEMPDLILLDIMMPAMDGFEVCQRLREWSQIPIIMLTARGDERDKVKCLDTGADDYIAKPFGVNELMARVRAVLRRTQLTRTQGVLPLFTCGKLEINFSERRVAVDGQEVKLTPTEYALLKELALNQGKVLTYSDLLQRVWGQEYRDEREYLHVFSNRLRAKFKSKDPATDYIVTVGGVGYKMEVKE